MAMGREATPRSAPRTRCQRRFCIAAGVGSIAQMAAPNGSASAGSLREAMTGLRSLPSVDALASRLSAPRRLAVAAARAVIDERRAELLADGEGAATVSAAG